jgi:hypothetical protein
MREFHKKRSTSIYQVVQQLQLFSKDISIVGIIFQLHKMSFQNPNNVNMHAFTKYFKRVNDCSSKIVKAFEKYVGQLTPV